VVAGRQTAVQPDLGVRLDRRFGSQRDQEPRSTDDWAAGPLGSAPCRSANS
jgi:hypothetical protein